MAATQSQPTSNNHCAIIASNFIVQRHVLIHIFCLFAMNDEAEVESTAFVRTIECGDKTLHIKQLYVETVGCVVWDAALVLCKVLENPKDFGPEYWAGKLILELRSGTGTVGLAAAALG